MDLRSFEQRIAAGDRLTGDEALQLYRHAPTYWLGRMADQVRQRKHPEGLVTYIIDRNVNYTNVCVARCNFCAFYREVGHGEGYVLAFDEIFKKIEETRALGGVQLLLQGGHNPDLPLAWYEDLFRAVKQRFPDFKLHALSPPEVLHISRMAKLPVPEVIARLIAAGLDSIPGGGAEILVDRVRKLLNCYSKASADEWLDVMRHAHRAGLRTTATMMYGTVETDEERLEHMLRLRAVQDETGGFTAFITWSYQPEHTERGGTEATGIEYLRTLAIARLVLDNFDNLQASWVTQGGKVGQLSLAFGANDMGSVMIEENVVRAAGAVVLHGRGRDRAQCGRRRVHGEASQHALRDPRRPVLPRARSAAHAGAVDGARGRRHVGARGVGELRGAQCRWARSSARGRLAGLYDRSPVMTAYRAAWVVSDRPLADSRRRHRGRGRTHHRGRHRIRRAADRNPRSRQRRDASRARQRAYASRTLVAARARAAGESVHRLGEDAGRDSARHRAVDHTRRRWRSVQAPFASCARREPWRWATSRNSLAAVEPMQDAGLHGVVFHELLGFAERDGALIERDARATRGGRRPRGRPRLARAARAVFDVALSCSRPSAQRCQRSDCPILSVHLGESVEEVELLEKGSGPWRGMLRDHRRVARRLGDSRLAGRCSILDRHGVIDARTLVVHGVQFDEGALARLRQIGATLVTCPRSNRWVGAGYPPIDRFYASGVAIAVGTDSLASVEDLNLFSELKTMRWLAPQVPARKILESATLVGAKALGLESDLGSITPGKRAELICVQLPDAVEDVEEYLVSGIEPAQIQPLNCLNP